MRKGVSCLLTLACMTLAGSGGANASQALTEEVAVAAVIETADMVPAVNTEEKMAVEGIPADGTNSLTVPQKDNPMTEHNLHLHRPSFSSFFSEILMTDFSVTSL